MGRLVSTFGEVFGVFHLSDKLDTEEVSQANTAENGIKLTEGNVIWPTNV